MNNSQSLTPGKHGFGRSNTFNRNQPVALPCELGQESFSTSGRRASGRGEVRTGVERGKDRPFPCNWSKAPPGTQALKGRTITSSYNHLLPPRVLTWLRGAGLAPLGHTPARTSSPRAAHARAGHACVSGPAPFRERSACLALPWSCRAAKDAAGPPGNAGGPNPTPVAAARATAMVSNPVHGLPFLPGTSFKDLTVRTSPAKPLTLSFSPSNPLSAPQLCSPRHHHTRPHPLSPVCSQPIPLWFFHSILAVCWPPSVLPCCAALAGFPHLVPELPRPSP